MTSDLLGESLLLTLGFSSAEEGTYIFDTLVAKADRETWVLGSLENPTTLYSPLQATDLVAFCHRCLLEEKDELHVRSVQRLLPKAILLRQMLRLSHAEVTA